MEKYLSKIKKSPLFLGITEDELFKMLTCFGATIKQYESGDMIIRQGDVVSKIYMILEGSVYIEKDSYWGRRIIIQKLNELNNIALGLVASRNIESTISAVCSKKATILALNFNKCSTMCTNACNHHVALIQNMFKILSKENIELLEKIENISQKSIRDKLLTFLSNESLRHKSSNFEINFNRQELADYLNIDRSAMSFEMSKLKNEGVIDFEKNRFILYELP
ncbi:MAG: Crp/Fnr family transcriptional regulator [Candidatus Gastranaerophilales bacterium]|nr:Crp/Fnr family transcriptional regulator [Candidatus Gastranaerophilales bacterium]